jgi:hypothetical protein
MMMNTRGRNIHALNGIRTHGLSVQAIKAYASDRAATGNDETKSYNQGCGTQNCVTLICRSAYYAGGTETDAVTDLLRFLWESP